MSSSKGLLSITVLLLFSMFGVSFLSQSVSAQEIEENRIQFSRSEIDELAQKIVDDAIDVAVLEELYSQLEKEQQVELLETVGIKQGISPEVLRNADIFDPGATPDRIGILASSELIEHRTTACLNCAYFASTYWTSALCDNDPSDVDFVFRFGRPPGATSGYRASDHISALVWAMLAWYQNQYGGINAYTMTSSRIDGHEL